MICVLKVMNVTTNISDGKEGIFRCCYFDKHGSKWGLKLPLVENLLPPKKNFFWGRQDFKL